MRHRLHTQRGFTLIELMIVVAIIGVLAAIAIPSFLSYQLKAKTTEPKTNLAAIKTASLSFHAERSCFLSVQSNGWPGTVPANGAQLPWPSVASTPTAGALCINPLKGAPAPAIGTFGDVGFTPSGPVRYNYYLSASQSATPAPGPMTNSCPNWPASLGAGAATAPTIGFMAQAQSDLDGDGKNGGFMVSNVSQVVDCAANTL
ncbi:MAG: type IV pilin protein [Nitrospiraceae bacterium]